MTEDGIPTSEDPGTRGTPAPGRITVVGVCGSGKSELVRRLAARGFDAHSVAQEHSHVAELWRHELVPDVLIYLQASTRVVQRRGRRGIRPSQVAEQRRRLAHARRHAHLRIQTDHLTPEQVEESALEYLKRRGVRSLSC